MDLVTFHFELESEHQKAFIVEIEESISLWKEQGYQIALFKEANSSKQFVLAFSSDKSPEVLTRLIQEEPKVKAIFEKLKASKSRIVVSVLEQIL